MRAMQIWFKALNGHSIPQEITHLQFANGTVIFCAEKEEQVKNIKAIILSFEAVFGLKVNFFKQSPAFNAPKI